ALVHGFVSCQLQQVGVDIVDAPADESHFSEDADRGLSDGFALAYMISLGNGNLLGSLPDVDQAAGATAQCQGHQEGGDKLSLGDLHERIHFHLSAPSLSTR
ncbi:MAG: hypothetical protein JSR30_06995, partial [Proteobacteria bacterium]|nr:hypothetical protein [Pseudomonadota bacterium]